ncbi:MAG: hypothetical protein IKJ25_02720 [Clostridia bacterium]|nr:hypothetical protein [Clostridia bacterium]
MKHTRKILIALLLVMTLMVSMATIFASAAETPEKLYLTPNANWKKDGARFAARFWTNTPSFSEQWVDMKDPDGDGIYECQIPEGMEFVIICRMNPGNAANGWDNKWNQTSDLTLPTNGTNHYIVKEDTWDNGGGNWATYGSTCLHTNLGDAATCTTPQICLDCKDPVVSALGHAFNEAHLCTRCNVQASFTVAGSGAHLGTEWDTGNTANDMTYADGVYTKVYENVAAGSYAFKVVRDHSWGTAYPSADKEFTVETAGSTVTITLKGTEVEIAIEAPQPEAPAHVNTLAVGDTNKIVIGDSAVDNGYGFLVESVVFVATEKAHYEFAGEGLTILVYDSSMNNLCGFTGKADLEAGTYIICIAANTQNTKGEFNVAVTKSEIKEPEAPAPVKPIVNISDLTIETTTDAELVEGTGISASAGLTVDGNKKSIDGFEFTKRLKLGGTMKLDGEVVKAGVKIVVDGPSKVIVYGMASSSSATGRTLHLATIVDGKLVSVEGSDSGEVGGAAIAKYEFAISEAGTYYLGSTDSGINLYYIAVEEVEAPAHVNTLVVGDTNKIVIGDTAVDNGYGYLVESVLFTATESAHYEFVGEGLTILVYDAKMNNLCGFTGKANLEAGTYIICIAANTQNTKGEFNVAVKKAAWNNTLAIGDNKVLITAIDNGAGYYIAWAPFEVTEKANYTFTGDGILALVYDSANQLVSGTELDVGTYNICVAFLTPATTGIAPVKVEKTPLADTPVVEEPTLALGDNTVTIDGSETNLAGTAVAWHTFTPAEDGTYKFSCDELTVYILSSKNMADGTAYIGADGVAELKADTKYYVLVGKDGVKGEFTVKVESGAAPVHVNTIVVGDNKYIISDALLKTEYEFLLIEITEAGIYKFTGGAPMTLFVFHDAYVGEALDKTAPYTDNVDDITYEYVDHFYVNLAAPGYYWVGFRYDYVGELREFDINVALHSEHTFAEGKCTECGAADPNYVPPHEHKFVEGKCECGETDPNYVAPEQPKPEDPKPEELGFFQMILKAITDFFAKVGNFFSGIFGKIGGFFSGLFGGNK